jgi:two-component system phosphate regulon response regulator PhoB
MSTQVLVIEDEPDLAQLFVHGLRRDGFEVRLCDRGLTGLAEAGLDPPDVVVLDLALPDVDGLEVCRRLRRMPTTARVGIVVVTARGTAADRVTGLEAGADDYVVKPVTMRELSLRARAVARRSPPATNPEILTVGALQLDRGRRSVTVAGRRIELRRLELLLLEALMQRAPATTSRRQLLAAVWPHKRVANARIVDVTVSRLRDHLGDAADLIETVPHGGYRIRAAPAARDHADCTTTTAT